MKCEDKNRKALIVFQLECNSCETFFLQMKELEFILKYRCDYLGDDTTTSPSDACHVIDNSSRSFTTNYLLKI